MKKNADSLVSGAIVLVLFTVLLRLAISLKFFLPDSLTEFISESSNPGLSLWIVSGLVVMGTAFLIKIGVKIPALEKWIEKPARFFSLLLVYPTVFYVSILVFLGLSLYFLKPVCESPVVNIKVTSTDETMKHDRDSVTARLGTNLTLEADTKEMSLISCRWSATGDAINVIGPQSSCITQVRLANNKPGRGIVTLTVAKSSCSVTSTHPLEIIAVP